MLSRALSLATVTLLSCFVAVPAFGQATNLEAGKSPSQIFAGTCNACHKSPRGLLRTVSAGSLPGFLRQHYTTSSEMASLLASFLVSNGAADTRYVGAQGKPGAKDAKQEAKPGAGPAEQLDRFGRRLRPGASPQEAAKPEPAPQQQAAKPDADGISPQADPGRLGRNAKRPGRPGEAPDGAKPAAEGQLPALATIERGPDGRKLTARQRLSKPGRPGGEEPSKLDDAKTDAAKTDAAKTDAAKTDAAKEEAAKGDVEKDDKPKNESVKDESKSETAKIEAPKESGGEPPALRPDPVPPVTPAPPAPPAVSASVNVSAPEPAAAPPAPAVTLPPAPAVPSAPPAVTASVPSPAPVAPAGPPAPPISQ
jgi:hypothetical protein